jgi:hypothetical protein
VTACCLLPAAALSLFKVFLTASPPVSLLSQTIPCSYCWQQFHLNKHTMHRIMGIGKTFHPGDPKNFDYPRSWSNETGYPPYYDFEYWLTSAATKKNSMLPATNTSYTGICPGDCDWAGKGGSCVPKGEVNATGGSLAGPIAVWCALDEPDEVCEKQPFFLLSFLCMETTHLICEARLRTNVRRIGWKPPVSHSTFMTKGSALVR